MKLTNRLLHSINNLRLFCKSRRYKGSTFHCPLCHFDASSFLPSPDGKRTNVRCPRCDALERHRAQWLFGLSTLPWAPLDHFSVLHFTPEFCTMSRLLSFKNIRYFTSEYPRRSPADYCIDLQRIPFDDCSFDVIICNHILEHVPSDTTALAEIFRVIKTGGYAFIQVPLDSTQSHTLEDPRAVSPAERTALYGQEDHVRLYGTDFYDRLQGAGFKVNKVEFWNLMTAADLERYALTDREPVFICRKD